MIHLESIFQLEPRLGFFLNTQVENNKVSQVLQHFL